MNYIIKFSQQAEDDLIIHKKYGKKAILKKIISLIEEIAKHPYVGTGKPEPLKYEFVGKWSRRINHEHRIIYEVENDKIVIYSLKGHY